MTAEDNQEFKVEIMFGSHSYTHRIIRWKVRAIYLAMKIKTLTESSAGDIGDVCVWVAAEGAHAVI
jgi:hypothetical protein